MLRVSLRKSLPYVAGITVGFAGYEALKLALFPHQQLWQSHLMSLAVVALLSAGVTVWFQRALQAQLDRVGELTKRLHKAYQLATTSGRVGVWEWDAETDEIYAEDRTLSEMLGFETRPRRTGGEWLEVVHPADRDRAHSVWTSLVEGTAESAEFVYRVVNGDGTVWWQDTRCSVSEREAGRVRRIIGVTTDITERKRAEEALRESEQRYRSFFELNAMGAGEVDLVDGRYLRANDAFCQMTGYSREELLGMRFADITHPDDRDDDSGQFARLLRGEVQNYRLEKRYVRKDGQVVWVQLTATLIRDSAGTPVSEVALVLDITEHKRAEEELMQLATRLLQSQDEERRRIARELHDETAQTIFAINLNLAHLLQTQPALEDEPQSILAASLGMGEHILQDIRTLSYLLHPPLLDQVGLESAVEEYVDGFVKRSGIEVALAMTSDVGRLPTELETALFRVVQESLTNIHRHSESERASIRLAREHDLIVLEVKDQGSGIAGEAGTVGDGIHTLGIGISGMRQRMHQLGGRLDITSSAGGTVVTAVVPSNGVSSHD